MAKRRRTTGPVSTPPPPASARARESRARAARPRNRPTFVPKVRVRMYRHGLGDCFLLTFDVGGDERHVLIDCGTLGNKSTGVKIAAVADDIERTIGEGRLHLVVLTHEHWDHVSGFGGPMRRFAGCVDQVWMAWTEDPEDDDAKAFARTKRDLGEALAAVATATRGTAVAAQLEDLLGFAGDASLGAAKFSEGVDEAITFVRTGLGVKAEYRQPGQVIDEDWLPGFRFYVLGPPRGKEFMKVLGGHGSAELYGVAAGLRAAALLRTAADGDGVGNDPQLPFDQRFRRCDASVKARHYPAYVDPSEAWRTIEEDWLAVASDLALQLDGMTNNTSLALAIERVADGKVLLFPADAQQGNWLSWHAPGLAWTVRDSDGAVRQVSAADLLGRTVFYKVGHHASHNATARDKGLELMRQEGELTAFIPVDRTLALSRNPKDSWQMPARPLYRRLLEKCRGRVVRSDTGWADDAANAVNAEAERGFRGMATDAEWANWRAAQRAARNVRITDTFVDYTLP